MQLSATATYSDGSSKDVTSIVVWRSTDTSVVTIDSDGLASAQQSGEAIVTAALATSTGTRIANQDVIVVPPGTFRLAGRVMWQQRVIEGAAVQVTAGIGAGLTGLTGSDGFYRLYGVAGPIEVTVSKAAFATIQQQTTVNANTTLNFDMGTVNPLPQLAGTYTLQIAADPACGTGPQPLPTVARVRQYTGAIDQGPTGLRVSLTGANFLPHAAFLFGYVTPDGAVLDVNHLDYYYGVGYPPPDLGEVLPDGTVYSPSGSITVTAAAGGLTGTLNGAIKVWGVAPTGATLIAECSSPHHTVTFTKQSGNTTGMTATHR